MEIKLLQKETPVWRIGDTMHKQVSVHGELVVPDTSEDVKEILVTRGGLLLKGKEPGLHATTITGEAWANILYLTEFGKVESICLRKDLEIVFDAETADPEVLPHLTWYLSSVQSKLLNPRKFGVNFEVQATLRSFARAMTLEETSLPDGQWKGLHVRESQADSFVLSLAAEKLFTLREQITVSANHQSITRIDAENTWFELQSTEQIGGRCIVKGEMVVLALGRSEDGLPQKEEFRIPVSQLLDITEETLDQSMIWVEPNSLYLELSEDVGGERSLDLEVHALLQMCAFTRKDVRIVSDAYSNAMPMEIETCDKDLTTSVEPRRAVISADSVLSVPEEMKEILAAEGKLGALERKDDKPQPLLHLDLLYRQANGELASVRRTVKLDNSAIPTDAEILNQRLLRLSVNHNDRELHVFGKAEVYWEEVKAATISTISLLRMDDENAWEKTDCPSVYLVRRGGESLWDLARDYHSSEELILTCNPENADLLLIPAES